MVKLDDWTLATWQRERAETGGAMGRFENANKRELCLHRDGTVCWLCGYDTVPNHKYLSPSLDHVTPKSKGGTDSLENLRIAHRACNNRRGNLAPLEALPVIEGFVKQHIDHELTRFGTAPVRALA